MCRAGVPKRGERGRGRGRGREGELDESRALMKMEDVRLI